MMITCPVVQFSTNKHPSSCPASYQRPIQNVSAQAAVYYYAAETDPGRSRKY